jgi:hypothetical protein
MVKDISYYKENAEENYTTTPVSVLRYISVLEAATKKSIDSEKLLAKISEKITGAKTSELRNLYHEVYDIIKQEDAGFFWDDETIAYFKSKNKPGCEGDYIRAITDFVKSDCTLEDGETYQELIEDLISKTRR